jgi:hypothetical protein
VVLVEAVPPDQSASPGRVSVVPVRHYVEGRRSGQGPGAGVPVGWRRVGSCPDPGTACPVSRRRDWPGCLWTRCCRIGLRAGQFARARRRTAGGRDSLGVGHLVSVRKSSVDAATRTALDPSALTTRSQRRSTPDGHGGMTQHRSAHRCVNMGRSIGCENIGRHEATLHSGAGSSLGGQGVVGSNPAVPTARGFPHVRACGDPLLYS